MRVSAFFSGFVALGLTAAGAILAIDEGGLFTARLTAWEVEAGKLNAPVAIVNAIERFEVSSARTDVIRDKTQLQRRLVEDIRFMRAKSPMLLEAASKRLESFSRALAAEAPMPGRVWCDLCALSAARPASGANAEGLLSMCFAAAPQSPAMIETRWRIALPLWESIGPPLRDKILADIDMVLGQRQSAGWAAERLAWNTARGASLQANMIRERILAHSENLAKMYDEKFLKYRKQAVISN